MLYLSKNNNTIIRLFECMALFVFLYSIRPWPVWHLDFRIVWLVAILIFSILFLHEDSMFESPIKKKLMPVLLLVFISWMQRYTLFGFVYGLGLWWCVLVILLLKPKYQSILVKFLTKWTAVVVGISLAYYLVYLWGIPLPHSYISFSDSSSYSEMFNNYYLFIS